MSARFRIAMMMLLSVAPACAGCRQGPAASEGTPSARYEAETAGPPEALLVHLRGLKVRMNTTDPGDLKAFREGMRAYSDAVVATAEALLKARGATPEQRREAAEAELSVLHRRMEVEPQALDRLLAAADRLEQEPQESGIRPIAAYHRVRALLDVTPPKTPGPDAEAAFDRLLAAILRLARAEPPHPMAPPILLQFASIAEDRHRIDQAHDLYDLMARRYPDDPNAKLAAGGAARIALKSRPVEDFSGPALDGSGTVELKSFRGKVVLIDFWATWCAPCMAEMPALKALRERLGPRGFEILGVTLDEETDRPKEVVKTSGMGWPQILNSAGHESDSRAQPPLSVRYGVSGIPHKLLIDRDGRLVADGHGLDDVKAAIEKLFPPAEPAKEK